MGTRTIVKIDEDKCTGCGECVTACAEGALAIVDGKAKLISERYCDGLGACLGPCPEDAITLEERDADAFDEHAAKKHTAKGTHAWQAPPSVCPGARAMVIHRDAPPERSAATSASGSELGQWPVQLALVPADAPYFQDADLLLTADCVPLALSDFHERLLRGRAVAVACPKLDDVDAHVAKLARILSTSSVRSLTVVHMEVPCCFGLMHIAKQAIEASASDVPLREVTVSVRGEVEQAGRVCAASA